MISEQRKGEFYLLAEEFLWGWFPIVTLLSYPYLAPLWSMGLTLAVAAVFFGVLMGRGKKGRSRWRELKYRRAWADLAWSSFYIMLLFVLLFTGLSYTTAGNAALILFMQVFFAFLFFNLLQGEKMNPVHLAGAAMMSVGAFLVLFPGEAGLNKGDLLVLLAAVVAPIGNRYQQRARRYVHATTLLFVRTVTSLPVVLLLAWLYASPPGLTDLQATWWLMAINGVFLMGLSKIYWIEALHRLSVTKISAMTALSPLFTMLFAFFVLHEIPGGWQLTGILPILAGGILITRPIDPGVAVRNCRPGR
ncbi:DMT family transporter [Desulfurivibrio dismutans]|uniref:DMT family transporter n=1 Tax=Desulfurivibrio dismutans TaxID=1398908 RepID=UPI0023DB14D4|nr:DMT family transporter [Desulfurivibrio alkaliphilus]MDF1614162.1 DMT family transporter [Desulfurivibrio alkaliphilus]